MIPLQSELTGKEFDFIHSKNELFRLDFSFGGNWDYDHGSFDKFLDSEQKVWLRIPFRMTQGEMDAEVQDTEARIVFKQPFVLKHLYQEGLDEEARFTAMGGFVNQFQDPVDKDADIEQIWVEEARAVLEQAERLFS